MKPMRFIMALLIPAAGCYLASQGFRTLNKGAPFNLDVYLAFLVAGSGVGGGITMTLYSMEEKRIFQSRLRQISESSETPSDLAIAALELLGTTNQKPR